MEYLEYFDEKNKEKLGIEERETIHKKNLWHREIAVWVVNEEKKLLLQRRSSKKKQGANKFSITAGHVGINEKEIIAAQRELYEEIGIECEEEELKLIGIYKNEQENNNCFSYTYLVKTNKEIKDMKMQEEEVSELKYISIEELEDRIQKVDEEITFVKKPHIKLALEKIKETL